MLRTDARAVKGMVLRSIGRESSRVRISFCPIIFTLYVKIKIK